MTRHSRITRLLHWLLVPLLWALFGFGKYLENAEPSLSNFHLWGWHKSLGLLAFALILIRLIWRLTSQKPLPENLPAWQHNAAAITHLVLYVLMVLTPLLGWMASSASGLPITFFGVFDIPLIGPSGEEAERQLFRMHGICATILIVLSLLHVGAALHHHFVRRNNVLRRMLP